MPLSFILNDSEVTADSSHASMVLVDFIRKQRALTGTTVACREGDCGACTVLVGELQGKKISYRSITSCIYPLGNVAGKHVVTVEGINQNELTPVQSAMAEANGTQCGFCTPGFVMSLTGLLLKKECWTCADGQSAIDGNICRCTGYKSIERAIEKLQLEFGNEKSASQLEFLVKAKVLPEYFLTIPQRLKKLGARSAVKAPPQTLRLVGGGTDLYVQIPDTVVEEEIRLTSWQPDLSYITVKKGVCEIGGATPLEYVRESEDIATQFPRLSEYLKLFGSTQIRQQATLGGNLVNASPIGDSTIMMLALDATIVLLGGKKKREVKLRDFYRGYKKIDKAPHEILVAVRFNIPGPGTRYHFEKVSRRTYLDIASVNAAIQLRMHNDTHIAEAFVSAGGVAAVPLFLKKTAAFLKDKEVTFKTVQAAAACAQDEVRPISDVRGSAEYKQLLLRQLMYAHFANCFPESIQVEAFL